MSGIASEDAICMAAIGRRSANPDHDEAISLLRTVDSHAARRLSILITSKTFAHYGARLEATSFIDRASYSRALHSQAPASGELASK